MNWQKELRQLEQNKQWDQAIKLMQNTITENPESLDVYLSMAYLLMNLLVEEDYDESQLNYYMYLTKKYFDESQQLFYSDPKYLFYIGRIAVMSEWFFGIDVPDYDKMLLDAIRLEPDNMLYQWSYYDILDRKNPENRKKVCDYAKKVLDENSPIKSILPIETSLGAYLLDLITNWSKGVLEENTTE